MGPPFALIHRIAPPSNMRSVLLKALCGEQAEMDSKVELSGSQASFYQAPWHPATNNVLEGSARGALALSKKLMWASCIATSWGGQT